MKTASKMVLDKDFWIDNTEYGMKNAAKGFTLIELLIVIAVLGILAVAVLSAINPIEQINRSNDTGSRSDSEQLLGAIDRYYTANGFYPWQTKAGTGGTPDVLDWTEVTSGWTDGGSGAVLTKLSTGGTQELKQSFITRVTGANYNYMWAYDRGQQGDTVYLCFSPKSGSFNNQAWLRCGSAQSGTGLPLDLQGAASHICTSSTQSMSCLP